jgi:phage terminase large subunit
MLSDAQKVIANSPARFRVAVCGRRFGKTHLAIRELCKFARQPEQRCWAIFPSYRQAKQVAWSKLKKKLISLNWVKKINESELTITLINDSEIALKGADNYDSLRGVGLDFIVMDEFADIDQEAWTEVLRPTLSDKMGSALFISTPKGINNWAYDLFMMKTENPQWASWQFTTIEGGRVPEEELESAKQDLDERTFRQEYLASFETYAGRIYYSFERTQNAIDFPIDNISDIDVLYTGWDFNIDPMSVIIATRQGDDLYVIDEIRMFSSNTQEAVDELKSRYPKTKIWAYPDPASRQRKTSAGGTTDLTILQNAGFVVKCPNNHTPVRDRINAVNARLCDSTGIRHLYIHPRCKYTIEGLERQIYKEGTTTPDKDGGYDHQMDALGYMVDYLFPIKKDTSHILQPRVWGHKIAA